MPRGSDRAVPVPGRADATLPPPRCSFKHSENGKAATSGRFRAAGPQASADEVVGLIGRAGRYVQAVHAPGRSERSWHRWPALIGGLPVA
jgi:hypothetical protein